MRDWTPTEAIVAQILCFAIGGVLALLVVVARADEPEPVDSANLTSADIQTNPIDAEIKGPFCGTGPVEIEIWEYRSCPNACQTTLVPGFEPGKYTEQTQCHAVSCGGYRTERWTDWPECDGEKIK